MKTRIAHSTELAGCIAQLKKESATSTGVVLFFASPKHDMPSVAAAFRNAFPEARVIGCSSAGELSSTGMSDGQIVAMAIPSALAPAIGAATVADPGDRADIAKALEQIAAELGHPLTELDPALYVGIVLVDGLSGKEEKLIEKLGDLSDIPFVGGSAGDDLAFAKTWVSLDGKASGSGAVLAVLNLPKGYQVVKSQSFRSTGKTLLATAVDEESRCVMEFNGERAIDAYARALSVPVESLPEHFGRHPLGLMIGGEPFVRSPKKILGNGAVVFYCSVRKGMELRVLESTNLIEDTRMAVASKCSKLPEVAGLVNFNCILRTLELKEKDQCAQYAELFREFPTAGFSTYGEEYLGHLNQTATMIVIGG